MVESPFRNVCRKEAEPMINQARGLEDIVLSFKNDGFAVIKNALPHSLIDLIYEKTLSLVSKIESSAESLRDIHRAPNGEISSMHNLANYMPEYQKLYNHTPIVEAFEAIYGPRSEKVINSSYFAKPKAIGYETKPHQDNAFFCMSPAEIITCWFPVEVADARNGSLYYYQGSWILGDIPHLPDGNLGASMSVSPEAMHSVINHFPKLYISLNKGDCVIHNPQIVHGSDANHSNLDRKAFNFSIIGKKAIVDKKLHDMYLKNLQEFLLRNKSISNEY